MNTNKKLNIAWPESFFTIQDIQDQHPDAKNITLRYRIQKAKEQNILVEIGKIPKAVGRPTIVLTKHPVNSQILSDAVAGGVTLHEEFEDKVITIARVDESVNSLGVDSVHTATGAKVLN